LGAIVLNRRPWAADQGLATTATDPNSTQPPPTEEPAISHRDRSCIHRLQAML